MRINVLTLILLCLSLSACGGTPTPDVEITAQATVAATQISQPTDTPMSEPSDTPTSEPSDTPTPELATNTPTFTATPQPECRVSATEMNIHEGPSLQFNVVEQTRLGIIFEAEERTADASWLFGVNLDTRTTGWVLATALTCNYPASQLPVAETLPPTYTSTPTTAPTPTPTPPPPTDTPIPAPRPTPTVELISEHDSERVSEHDGN